MSNDDNWTDQLQELLALQAICEDDFQFIGLEGPDTDDLNGQDVEALLASEPPTARDHISMRCQAFIRLELPEPITVKVGMHANIRVSYLLPIRVHLVLPPDYPSTRLPEVEVFATWLPEEMQDTLARCLNEYGEAILGAPVVFEYVQWLQDNALDIMGLQDGCLSLPRPTYGASAICHGDDGAGSSGNNLASSSSEAAGTERECASNPHPDEEWEGSILMQLHKYNMVQEVEKFKAGIWQCGICFEEVPGLRCIRLPGCSHFYCLECMKQHATINVKDGNLGALHCPMPDCGKLFGPEVLKSLLSTEDFVRWEELTLSRTLDCMNGVVYCPWCQAVTLEDSDHCAQCPECFYAFCGLCGDAWHPGRECLDTETKMEVLKKRSKGQARTGTSNEATLNAINELKSLKVMRDTSKQCPSCRMAIQKSSGCNKMVCTNCNTRFCYKCSKEISGYEHFSAGTCALFEQAEIDEWNAMMNRNQDGAWQAELLGQGGQWADELRAWGDGVMPNVKVSRCPQCRQPNAKVNNNNHIFCWACSAYHCYLCRKILGGRGKDRNGGRHFSSKGCKQHTSD